MTRPELARRRARAARAAKRAVTVEIRYAPDPVARDRLVDLLVRLLDARRHSGRA